MKHTHLTPIRSVLVESRDYSDTYGNTYSSAALWINGGFVGVFGLAYGSPEVLEDYQVTPYLEAVGILPQTPAGEYASHLRNRLKELGADYYLTQDHTTRRRCWQNTELEEEAELWALLLRREKNRVTA